MTQTPLRPSPRPARPGSAPPRPPSSDAASEPARRPRRPVPPSKIARRPAFAPPTRPARPKSWWSWGEHLPRAERERAKERLAFAALSGVLVVVLLLFGGTLLWDQVIRGQQPIVRIDGQSVSLRTYADLLSYRENVLYLRLQEAQQLATQPMPAGTEGSETSFLQQLAWQQISLLQNQLAGLSELLVEELVEMHLIRQEAARRGIVATPQEIEAELKQLIGYREPNATPPASPAPAGAESAVAEGAGEAASAAATAAPAATATVTAPRPQATFEQQYREYLRFTGGRDGLVRQDAESQILRRKLNEELAKAVSPTAEQVRASHILVPDETAARAALARLEAGESFAELAAELSLDTSNKDRGGDLGWFPRGVMVTEFEDAAFKLQPGQVSEPVKTAFGVHLILVEERDASRELEPAQLENLKSNALNRWLEAEKANHHIERFLGSSQLDWAYRHGRRPARA